MSEKIAFYIERLLSEIKSLEESVQEVSNSGNLPFSFFKESFNRTHEITGLLHDLEFLQVDDLKSQMERLVVVLSEKERKEQEASQEREREKERDREFFSSKTKDSELPEDREQVLSETNESETEKSEVHAGNIHAEGFVLPEYRNPHKTDGSQIKKQESSVIQKIQNDTNTEFENKVRKSLADTIKTPPALVDLKRGISLNDRFIFQRELFGNDRNLMNSTIEKLNKFESYEEAEEYVRENVTVDLDNPAVIDFLSIVKKVFK
ncbi:MAG: hypothetical protein PHV53_01405 [Fermentimonas sp.]|nr:hypothetical protein [Fermentimonas sp.]